MSSGGGGGGSSGQDVTNETILPDWVQSQVTQNMAMAQAAAAQPYQQYSGPTLADFTPDQLAAFQAVRSLQGTSTAQLGDAYSKAANLPAAAQSLLNPYEAKVGGDVTSNMLRASGAATGNINANAAATGAFGGTSDAVQRGAIASETQRNIGQAINSVASQGWSAATGTALQQAQSMGDLAVKQQTASLTDANALAQVGQQQQTAQQAQYADALNKWQQQQNWPYQQLAILQSALAGSPYGNQVKSSQPYNSNTAASILGMAASTVPLISGIGGLLQQEPSVTSDSARLLYMPDQPGYYDTGGWTEYS